MRNVIADLWNGRTPLPRAFWEYAICYGTLLNLVTTFASLAALSMGAAGLVALAIHFIPLPYNLLSVVGVWRSADHYRGSAIWRPLSRTGVIVWALIASLT
jgi:hypothetical protein